MRYEISPFVKSFTSDQYIALYNFYNGRMQLYYGETELMIIKPLLEKGFIESSELGIYAEKLYRNHFVVDSQQDMYDLIEQEYKHDVYDSSNLHLIIMMGEACNYGCKYCYESESKTKLSWNQLDGIINFVLEWINTHQCGSIEISWFGGEPTLFKKETIAFMEKLNASLPATINVSGSMTTNGYLLTSTEFLDYYRVGIKDYQITVDGFATTHDKMRPLKGGGKTWDTVINNLKSIYNLALDDVSVLLRINYNTEVLKQINDFMLFIKQSFGNQFKVHVHPIFPSGKNEHDDFSNVNDADAQLGEFILSNDINSDFAALRIIRYGGICYASKPNSFLVDPSGVIRKCTVNLQDDKNVVGKIVSATKYEIDSLSVQKWSTVQFNEEECAGCCFMPVCMRRACPSAMLSDPLYKCPVKKEAIVEYLRHYIRSIFENLKISLDLENANETE